MQVTLWDMSVEEDVDAGGAVDPDLGVIPSQLLFVHQVRGAPSCSPCV